MVLISIISGKGGVGKTTTAINIGSALNAFGKEVIIVDANLTTPSVGLHFGAPIVPVNLNHALLGKAKISEAIYEHESGTKIVPSSLSVKELKRLNIKKLKDVGKKLRKMADYVIFDSAAGLGEEAISSMEASDEIIIVTNPEIMAVTNALKTLKLAEEMGKEVRGIIINKVSGAKHEMSIQGIRDMLEIPILGVVPDDKKVPVSLMEKDALVHVYPRSKAALAYKKIAARIAGINYKEQGLFSRVFS